MIRRTSTTNEIDVKWTDCDAVIALEVEMRLSYTFEPATGDYFDGGIWNPGSEPSVTDVRVEWIGCVKLGGMIVNAGDAKREFAAELQRLIDDGRIGFDRECLENEGIR